MRQVPDTLHARIVSRTHSLCGMVARNKTVANRFHAVVPRDAKMVAHVLMWCVTGRQQEIMPAAVYQAAFKTSNHAAMEQRPIFQKIELSLGSHKSHSGLWNTVGDGDIVRHSLSQHSLKEVPLYATASEG